MEWSTFRTSAIVAAVGVGLPVLVHGQTVDATALTLLAGRQDPRDGTVHTVVPAYEEIWLSARDVDIPGVHGTRIVVSGWGMVAGGTTLDDRNVTGDVDVAFIEGKLFDRHLGVRLGRQLVASGVARNLQLDGADVVALAPAGIRVQIYGGVPVPPRFGYAHGQGVIGGRLSWRPSPIFEGGLSFVDILDDGLVDRQEAGVDARAVVTEEVTLTALAAFSILEQRISEASLRALWQPLRNLEVTAEAARTAPDLFVSRASIFSVFAEEAREEGGATVYFRPWARLRLWGDGFVLHDDSGTGGRAGLRASLAVDGADMTQIGVQGRVLALPASRYVQGRIYGLHRFGRDVTATLDCDAVWLDPRINGENLSLTFAATVGWDFAPGWRGLVSGLTGRTPLLEWRTEAMAKLVYNFDYRAKKVTP
ncbi:MAG TPA: hypothetical protein VKE22_05120 [Haliangiales bacterium]|nr:hypothetical protein [Haliangiales bacterium]